VKIIIINVIVGVLSKRKWINFISIVKDELMDEIKGQYVKDT
jgi:hypothetical protein